MKHIIVLLLALSGALVLTGCNSGIDADDLVRVSPNPETAASPNILSPRPAELFTYDATWPSRQREFLYQHKGTSHYTSAISALQSSLGATLNTWFDRKPQGENWYWTEKPVNQAYREVPADGSYIFKATYATRSASFGYGNESERLVAATRAFVVCSQTDFSCRSTGTVYPSAVEPVVHTAAMGPFIATSSMGSSVSQQELEAYAETLTREQVDNIAGLIEEAYGEDIYDFLGMTPPGGGGTGDGPGECGPTEECVGGLAFSGAGEGVRSESDSDTHASLASTLTPSAALDSKAQASSFDRLTNALAAADRRRMSPQQQRYLNWLLRLGSRLSSAASPVAQGPTTLGVTTPSAGIALANAPSVDGRTAAGAAEVWPNPAVLGVHVRVQHEGATAVEVYDLQGRRVAQAAASKGTTWTWDLRSAAGQRVAPGMYHVIVLGERGPLSRTAVMVR